MIDNLQEKKLRFNINI